MPGAKPDLNKPLRNVVMHPSAKGVEIKQPNDEPTDAHKEIARKLRPTGLNAAERKFWDGTAAQMVMLGRLRPHFVTAYAEYVMVVCRMAETRKKLEREGWVYESQTRNGLQKKMRPEVGQLNDDWRKWRSLVGSFGLAPAESRHLTNGPQGDMFGDDWDQF